MSEELDIDAGLYTPAGTPSLPASQVTATPFTTALYPTQLGGPPVLGRAGEVRGFFAGNRWRPSWSRFGFERQPPKKHAGVDIYAPRGTAIVAMVAGQMELKAASDGNGMGNRAHIHFTASGVSYRFIIGHLDRFEGAARSVNKGEVIGYAGCTGNAAGNQPCLTPNSCGKYSTHIHLELWRNADLHRLDPLGALNWTLTHADDNRDVPCAEVVA